MKVYISRYRDHWISPYRMLEYMFFWTAWSRSARWTLKDTIEDERRERSAFVEHPEWVDRWSDRLTPISQAIQWVLDRVHPRVTYVKIDPWDTWSMDHTLAAIILPMLHQLKTTAHGSPNVADEDVPEHLRSTAAAPKENEWATDSNHHERWQWILDEIIFAFEMKCKDDWTDEFHTGVTDVKWVPVDKDGNQVPKGEHRYYQMVKGPNDTSEWDQEGQERVQKRITNGFRLFGKYYEALWD